jgi:membrane protein DedA with SNARE-associated domain
MVKYKIRKRVKTTIINRIEEFEWKHRNLIFLLLSVIIATIILKSAFIQDFIKNIGIFGYLGSFIVGLFFPYGLTTVPATATFLILAKDLNPFFVALIGAIGALISDYLIFRFIGKKVIVSFEEIASDIPKKLENDIEKTMRRIRKSKIFHHLMPIIAGFIIATPLPDELVGILFGSVKFDMKKFLILSLVLHFITIFVIVSIGNIL